jgi:hypothetical protein
MPAAEAGGRTLVAENHAHGLRVTIGREGVVVRPANGADDGGSWSLAS